MAPTWLTVIAWISLVLGFLIAGTILYDILGRGLRQPIRMTETWTWSLCWTRSGRQGPVNDTILVDERSNLVNGVVSAREGTTDGVDIWSYS